MQSERSKDQRDGFSKGEQSIPSGVNIIVWIVYVYCSVIITYFKLLVRIRSILFQTGSDSKKTPSRPSFQNTGKRSRDESRRRIYARKIPHAYMLSLK